MNASAIKFLFAIVNLVLLTACSLAPVTPRVDAASIGKNNTKIETNLVPSASLGFIYGAGDNVDIGLEVEQALLSSAWTRYSFINNPNGLSVAANAAVFISNGEIESNGWYTGLLLSYQFNPNVRWSAGIRYAVLHYEFGDVDHSNWYWDDFQEFDNPDDGSHNGQLDLSMSWRVKPHIELTVGALCQRLLKNSDPARRDERCSPILGLSFYRL